jgi:hypothetical protein
MFHTHTISALDVLKQSQGHFAKDTESLGLFHFFPPGGPSPIGVITYRPTDAEGHPLFVSWDQCLVSGSYSRTAFDGLSLYMWEPPSGWSAVIKKYVQLVWNR